MRSSHFILAVDDSPGRVLSASAVKKPADGAAKQSHFGGVGVEPSEVSFSSAASGAILISAQRTVISTPNPANPPAFRFARKHWIGMAMLALLLIAGWALREKAKSFHWDILLSTITGLHWGWMSLAIGLILLTYLGRALRWEIMIRSMCPGASVWYLFKATAIGFTAIVLFGRAGELVRPYLIAKQNKLPFSSQMAVWLIERIFDLLMVLLIFGAALTQVSHTAAPGNPGLRWVLDIGGWVAAGVAFAALTVLLAFRYFTESAHQRLLDSLSFLPETRTVRIRTVLASFSAGMGSTRDNGFAIRLLVYTFVEWSLVAASFLAVFRAFPATASLDWNDILVFMGFVSFGSAIQIPGIGGGMQIAAIVVLTELFGLSLEVSTGLAFVFWATSFATIVPFGIGLALHEGIQVTGLRQLANEATAAPEPGV